MSLIKVRPNGQVTLPSSLRERAKLRVGDLLEAKLEKGRITLTPASLIDRHITESQERTQDDHAASVPLFNLGLEIGC